jgi:hypothetical protein
MQLLRLVCQFHLVRRHPLKYVLAVGSITIGIAMLLLAALVSNYDMTALAQHLWLPHFPPFILLLSGTCTLLLGSAIVVIIDINETDRDISEREKIQKLIPELDRAVKQFAAQCHQQSDDVCNMSLTDADQVTRLRDKLERIFADIQGRIDSTKTSVRRMYNSAVIDGSELARIDSDLKSAYEPFEAVANRFEVYVAIDTCKLGLTVLREFERVSGLLVSQQISTMNEYVRLISSARDLQAQVIEAMKQIADVVNMSRKRTGSGKPLSASWDALVSPEPSLLELHKDCSKLAESIKITLSDYILDKEETLKKMEEENKKRILEELGRQREIEGALNDRRSIVMGRKMDEARIWNKQNRDAKSKVTSVLKVVFSEFSDLEGTHEPSGGSARAWWIVTQKDGVVHVSRKSAPCLAATFVVRISGDTQGNTTYMVKLEVFACAGEAGDTALYPQGSAAYRAQAHWKVVKTGDYPIYAGMDNLNVTGIYAAWRSAHSEAASQLQTVLNRAESIVEKVTEEDANV